MNYKNLGFIALGATITSLGLVYGVGNPLKFGKRSPPTHYIAMDIDENNKKDNFALGYNNTKHIELYLKTEDGFKKINDAKYLELKKASNDLEKKLEDIRSRYQEDLKTIKDYTLDTEKILRETKAESK